jgi:hypothetical protein
MFDELLRPYVLHEFIFDAGDAAYIALVFAWINFMVQTFSREADPVIDSVRKDLGGSHWLLKFGDQRLRLLLRIPIFESEWSTFAMRIASDKYSESDLCAFSMARLLVSDRLSELKPSEAMLISIG